MADNASIPVDLDHTINDEIASNIANLANLTEYQLLHIWDSARSQVYNELPFVFQRFCETEPFEQYCATKYKL